MVVVDMVAVVFASTELVADSDEAAAMLHAAAPHQLVVLEEGEANANRPGQAFAQQEAVEAAHSHAPLSVYSTHDNDLAQPLFQAYPAFLFCMALGIAVFVVAASLLDPHRYGHEVSASPDVVSCLKASDRANSVQPMRTAGYWRRRIQMCRVLHRRARSDWTGPQKMEEVFASIRAAGRRRSDYLQIVVASLRSYLSYPARGTRLRRGTIRPVLTSSHNTRLRLRRMSYATGSQMSQLLLASLLLFKYRCRVVCSMRERRRVKSQAKCVSRRRNKGDDQDGVSFSGCCGSARDELKAVRRVVQQCARMYVAIK